MAAIDESYQVSITQRRIRLLHIMERAIPYHRHRHWYAPYSLLLILLKSDDSPRPVVPIRGVWAASQGNEEVGRRRVFGS